MTDPTLIVADMGRAGPAAMPPNSPLGIVHDGEETYLPCPSCRARIALTTTGLRWTVQSPRDIGDRLVVQLGSLPREELHVLLMNARNTVVGQELVYMGNVSAALVRVGELFREAIHRHAASVILVHNHPSGDPTPSPDDLHLTAEAIAAGRLLDLPVLDHVIVASGGFVSLRDRGVAFDRRATR